MDDHNNSNSKQSGDDGGHSAGIRRRGKALEDAILEAGWQELSEIGYNRLTMEGVAARAKTNKAVIYRRWPNKAMLIIAILQKYIIPLIPREIPDTGNLRDDVFNMLQGLSKPLRLVGAETIHGLMADQLSKALSSMSADNMKIQEDSGLSDIMKTMLKNAEKRGEVKLEDISHRVLTLPLDLFRFEMLITQAPISDETIAEIVDNIFMPLIMKVK
jgi:AcrR family transcriptional regulator